MSKLIPLNLKEWVENHRHLLKPPVGNAQIWKDTEFIVMVVGGPNQRTDWHLDPAEEIFYQLEGDITLKIMEDGKPQNIAIRQGEIFLLPAKTPHSPQRPANTIGIVVERARRPEETDRFRWYCDSCHEVLYDVGFHVTDLTKQLEPVFETFYKGDVSLRTCKKCKKIFTPPASLTSRASREN